MSASTPVGVTGTLELLRKLGPVSDEIVLVGGQALNFWAEQYRQLAPEFSGANRVQTRTKNPKKDRINP